MSAVSCYPRIIYRDDRRFPWVIVYGYDLVWKGFRTREGALRELERLMRLIGEINPG